MTRKPKSRRTGRPRGFRSQSVLEAEIVAQRARADALYAGKTLQEARAAANRAAYRSLRRINPRWQGSPAAARKLITNRDRAAARAEREADLDRLRREAKKTGWTFRDEDIADYSGWPRFEIEGPPTFESLCKDILMVARNPTVSCRRLRKQILIVLRCACDDQRLSNARKKSNRRLCIAVLRSLRAADYMDGKLGVPQDRARTLISVVADLAAKCICYQ